MLMKNKIVIIEDSPEIARSIEYILAEDGFEVKTSNSGYDGLAIAASIKPDLILLDIVMPGASGYEILEKIKEHPKLKEVPVIIFSNLPREDNENLIGETGAADYFAKSETDPQDLVAKIKKYLS